MYLRKMGRRFLLLHSQRLGDGRVLQRRLGHFEQGAELRRSLSCARWREQFRKKNPGVSVDWRPSTTYRSMFRRARLPA